ncbi:uncharacterized protein [Asterias amurensis]|uniref:uncharacterized protein n=1 Tax=Asterias amurensis TaxID=7602 RepID=UPI003AB288FE
MDETALATEGALVVAGVAPGTILAQISVALIAVAVTAVYILKNLPDTPPLDHPSPRTRSRRAVDRSPQRDVQRRVEGFGEENARDAVDNAGASTSRHEGTRGNDTEASHSSSLEEYRAIMSNDNYQDLCSAPDDGDKKSVKRKGSKEWPTSLESIDEEDEDEESKTPRGDAQGGGEPKPKQSPTRGSRVPKWYFSKASSGIPTLPKDRDYEDHFDNIPNKNSSEYIDEARKTAITGFRGPSIGIVQRKPWPKDGAAGSSSPNAHEYGVNFHNDFQTISQSEDADLNIAKNNFLQKGQLTHASFDQAERIYIPDIRILEPNVSSNGYEVGSEGPGGDESVWVETHASTVCLPEKSHDEIITEVVRVTLDDDEDGDVSDASREIARVFNTPIPKPRTSVPHTRPGTSHSTQDTQTAPPRVTKTPTSQKVPEHSSSDIDRSRREERALFTGAGQPSTNSNEGLYKQTKLGDSVTMKSDATLKLGVQTRTNFTERDNIDTVDNTHNGSPAAGSLHGKTHIGSRAFTLVGSKPKPADEPVTQSGLNTHVVHAEINSIPDTENSVSPTDTQTAPWGRSVKKIQLLTSRSPYGSGTTSLSTGLSSDENNKQRVNSAQITAQPESVHLEKRSEIRDNLPPASAGRNFETKSALVTDGKGIHTVIGHGNEIDGRSACDADSQSETTELDELRATLTDNLPLKRPKELLLNETTKAKKRDISPIKSENSYSRENDQERSDSEVSVTSPSDVISEQLERLRKSIDKLKVPDWYKKSSHYQRVVNKRPHAKSVVSDSDSEPRMTRSPSSCPSDCWSVTSSDDAAASQPLVSTKLAFQSEAKYRRDFPASFLNHEPIRNAVSCIELPTRASIKTPDGDPLNSSTHAGNKDHCQSADDTIYSQPFHNQTSSSLKDVNYDVPRTQSSPSRGLRLRSKSVGDNLDQITYFDSLAVKRLERHKYDSIFFVTGYLCDSDEYNLDEGTRSKGNNPGGPPNDSVDDMEYRRRTYGSNTTGSYPRDSSSPQNGNLQNGNEFINSRIEIDQLSKDRVSESKHFTPTSSRPDLNAAMEPQSPRTPVPAPRRNIMGSAVTRGYPQLTDTHVDDELKPDPRYNQDGSRNTKISPRFAMVTPSHGKKESPRSSPINTSPRRTNVKILITDTTLEDDDSDPSIGRQSDQDPSSSDQETVVEATSWTPLDLDKLKDSEFAAVVSVITSRHMQPGNRSGMYLPGSGFVPQQEVTMEEIVDSLLGLPYQRATSAVDLNSSGYRGSSSTSSPLTCSTPDLSSSWSAGQGSTSVSSSDKSHSVDSLYGEGDTNVLNALIFGRKRLDGDGYPSYEEDDGDAVGDEIIMVKCSYKKCAKTKELEEARKFYKTCHNCYTYYCSRQCRKLHWPRHKKRCLFGRVNSACKHVLYHSRYNGQLQSDLSRVARTGYLSRGRGAILLIFPDTEAAENYTSKGFDALPSPPTYSTVRELQTFDLFGDHMKFLLEMCCSYDPENKFVINVAIMASGEQYRGHRPRRTAEMAVKKCAKLKLSLMNHSTDPTGKEADQVPDTLILTSPTGPQGDGILDRKARQVCFVHIQRQLRQRGVSLRHQHAEIYDKLCRWVELHEHFVPVTIYPVDENTGKRFMCVLMPESEPNELGWVNNPELLEDIDLDAELEKLENVAGLVVTDL